MEEEKTQIRCLLIAAALLCAAIIAYNVLFTPQVALTVVQTDAPSSSASRAPVSGSEEYSPRPVSASGKLNLNTASAQEISDRLSGIGPVIAARIVAYREQHGAFRSAEDLKNIPGIGEKTLEKIRDEVIVG